MIVAIVQDGPVHNNKAETLKKTIEIICSAKYQGADLVVFGETWLSGYPAWLDVCPEAALWNNDAVKSVWADMFSNAVDVTSNDLDDLKKVVCDNQIWMVIGVNEKITKGPGNGTLYNSAFIFSSGGEIVQHHRKLMPTFSEKMVYGLGDGAGLTTVDSSFGRLGTLICWEHWMPMARQAMHEEAEDIHVALWPSVKEMHQVCSRQYAFEGRCHVVSAGQIMEANELPKQLKMPADLRGGDLVLKGGSCIYGPDGSEILSPQIGKREVIYRELDLSRNLKEKMNLSISGHYNRPDVFDFQINKSRHGK